MSAGTVLRLLRSRLMRVAGHSMSPRLRPGDLVFVERTVGVLQRGALVAARPSRLDGRAIIKRVAGTPGEDIAVEGRHWSLGPQEFFLMGDASGHSTDSRTFGPVDRGQLIGRVWARLWPWEMLTQPATEEVAT
jgi:signal peptidase I